MDKTMIIILKGDVPSKKNSKQIIWHKSGRPLIISSNKHNLWHREAMKELRATPFWGRWVPRCKITAVFYSSTKRKSDLSNKWESIGDLLVDSKILVDDNWEVIPELLLKYGGHDKKNPRVEIIFLPYEPDTDKK